LRWTSDEEPQDEKIGGRGWILVLARGLPLALVIVSGLLVLLLLRLAERPLFGARRPVTPFVTQAVCQVALAIMGLRRNVRGQPARVGAVVANHASWLDIFVLNAGQRVCFVSKSDVRGWPGIGWLARATGTVFIDRERRGAARQRDLLRMRLAMGHLLLFFPEGTSTDGLRVLPFRSTLFSAFFGDAPAGLAVQPVSISYVAPPGVDARFYGWWGEMNFGPHLLKVLARPRQGRVDVTYHRTLRVADVLDRKTLARQARDIIAEELVHSVNGEG
jgi:1-acyl-sn-glycerol-3-phosphate acyltransferase